MEPAVLEKPQIGYGPISAFIVTVSSFFGSQLLAGISIGIFPSIFFGWKQKQITSWLDSGILPQTLVIALSGVFTLLIIKLFLEKRRTTFDAIGLNRFKFSAVWQAGLGFVTYLVAYLIIISLVTKLIPSLDINQKQDLGFDFGPSQNIWLLGFSLIIIPPFVEEIVMRGFLFGGLRTKMPFIIAALVTSLLFGAAHLPSGKDGLLWVGAIDTFTLSLVLCFLREKTESLWPSILLHMTKNSLALFYLTKTG